MQKTAANLYVIKCLRLKTTKWAPAINATLPARYFHQTTRIMRVTNDDWSTLEWKNWTWSERSTWVLVLLWIFVALGILCEQVEKVGVFVLRLWGYSLSVFSWWCFPGVIFWIACFSVSSCSKTSSKNVWDMSQKRVHACFCDTSSLSTLRVKIASGHVLFQVAILDAKHFWFNLKYILHC